ncbi:histidinol-phosphatase HisJ [Bacillus marasmi]|uniref:histidinol-phosphatase HisJ n=1 Tax=Bacillus marasmi TaxID=1926279 RepID=UPI0011C8F607|nr:histidinol-phosphatase HisJ [Bacillus marasmi]
MIKDGHIHSLYCPHGTKDAFENYVEKAIQLGFKEISFTEHAPLPASFSDPAPTKDSAISLEQLDSYFHDIRNLKIQYAGQIKVNAGLEVDYIEGYEEEIKSFLNMYGPQLDDAILSVHFLKCNEQYECMDYSPDIFAKLVDGLGSVEAVYRKYYETLLLSVNSDLGPFKPKRIGHITLAHKFQRKFPIATRFETEMSKLLNAIKTNGYELDYNGAGCAKPLCREPYPPQWVVEKAIALNIPLVYGSDAHQVKDLGQGLDQMIQAKTS